MNQTNISEAFVQTIKDLSKDLEIYFKAKDDIISAEKCLGIKDILDKSDSKDLLKRFQLSDSDFVILPILDYKVLEELDRDVYLKYEQLFGFFKKKGSGKNKKNKKNKEDIEVKDENVGELENLKESLLKEAPEINKLVQTVLQDDCSLGNVLSKTMDLLTNNKNGLNLDLLVKESEKLMNPDLKEQSAINNYLQTNVPSFMKNIGLFDLINGKNESSIQEITSEQEERINSLMIDD